MHKKQQRQSGLSKGYQKHAREPSAGMYAAVSKQELHCGQGQDAEINHNVFAEAVGICCRRLTWYDIRRIHHVCSLLDSYRATFNRYTKGTTNIQTRST